MNDGDIFEEWGTDTGISFVTSQGILTLVPGKKYNKEFIEQPERLSERTPERVKR